MVTISRLTAGNWCRRTGRQAGRGQTLIYSNTHKHARTHLRVWLPVCGSPLQAYWFQLNTACLSYIYMFPVLLGREGLFKVANSLSVECALHAKWATAGHIICPSGNCTGTGFSVTAPASASLRDCVQTPSGRVHSLESASVTRYFSKPYVGGHQGENQKIFSP